MTLSAGTRLGPYEIVAPLGAGGMGEVYRALDPRIGREVALKILPVSVADRTDRLQRFETEARAAGALNHPNLVTVFDVGAAEGRPYIVTELLDGVTLRDRLPLSQRKAVEFALQIAAGVAAAHERGIVHRDLKPENVFITSDDRVKLLDFGLAKLLPDSPTTNESKTIERLTDPNVVMGTAPYMSPEQVRAQNIDHRSDIFSFGTMLVEMLTGANPFRRASHIETMHAILNEDPTIPAGVLTASLERLASHALAKSPSQRFQSMRDVMFALEMLSGTSESQPVKPSKRKREAPAAPRLPVFRQITFRRGFVMTARAARDGSIVYGAAWEDKPLELFASQSGEPEARSLGFPGADILAISPTNDLAISLGRRFVAGWITTGTLARVSLTGGAPREILEDVQDADWSPDGKQLGVIRRAEDRFVIEYPIGRRVYESPHWISHLKISPKGDKLAFVDHPMWGDNDGTAVVIDAEGNKKLQTAMLRGTAGIAWTPKGDELCVAVLTDNGRTLLAFSATTGRERTLLSVPVAYMNLHDITPTGDIVITIDYARREILAGVRGVATERNLSWFDWSFITDLSSDGKRILIEEQQRAARGGSATYLRPVDGSPAVYIGQGRARAISPDGKWIVTMTGPPNELEIVPTGAGTSRGVPVKGLEVLTWWYWFPDQSRLLLWGNEPGHSHRMFELPLNGDGTLRPIGPEGVSIPISIAPDGKRVAAVSPDGLPTIYDVSNAAEPLQVPASRQGDQPILWSKDNSIFVTRLGRTETAIGRIDLTTGTRTIWQELRPSDPAGIVAIHPMYLSADAQSYAYGFRRFLSDVHIVQGVL